MCSEETKVEQREILERARKAQSPSAGAAAKAGAKTLSQSGIESSLASDCGEGQLQGVQDRHPGPRRRLRDAWMIVEPEAETAADGEAAAGGEPAAGDEPAAGAMEVEAA